MRFTDFLKATVLTSAGAATGLAGLTVAVAAGSGDQLVVLVGLAWWALAGVYGTVLGRGASATPPIARLLADARTESTLPEVRPRRVMLNRLWPLLLAMAVAGGLAVIAPQVPAIAAGFAIIGALAWRRQEAAVSAIEERDGVRYYIERTSPVSRIKLVRTPGFKAARPTA